jgi:hypothetical protein
MDDVRKWFHYPIEMPVTEDGQGPATVGMDAEKITYEVWDQTLTTHASFDNLPDAINEAMRLNAALTPASDGRAEGLREAAGICDNHAAKAKAQGRGDFIAHEIDRDAILARAAELEGKTDE